METISFPVYRKYENDRSFFMIKDRDTFIELKITGKTFTLHTIKANILPERVMIGDMIERKNNHWIDSSKVEFEQKLTYCKQHLREI